MKGRIPADRIALACRALASFKTAGETEDEVMTAFGVARESARRVVMAARRELSNGPVIVDREEQRSKIRASLHELIRDAAKRGYHRHWLAGLTALVELDGLAEATRLAVEHFTADAPILGKRALAERLAELDARAKGSGGKGN
jgi:hypothetical protein